MKKLLVDCQYEQFEDIVKTYGQPAYRAVQLFDWIAAGCDFDQMTNLPKGFLEKLKTDYDTFGMQILEVFCSKDGSKKYLFKLRDGHLIESVFMPHDYGCSVCVSSQVGCKMGCVFCASGADGFVRNLSMGEILAQVLLINKDSGGTKTDRKVKNIVLMGSGEPLDNFDNIQAFLRQVTHAKGINIGVRNISLSTSGLTEEIRALADSGLAVTLSISLHATTDELRAQIMPIAKKHTIQEIVDAAKYYFQKTGRRVIFEYIMLTSNTDYFDVKRLQTLLKGFPTHINLIPLNSTKDCKVTPADPKRIERFQSRLTEAGISATTRKSLGSDIQGACGQLRRKFGGCKED